MGIKTTLQRKPIAIRYKESEAASGIRASPSVFLKKIGTFRFSRLKDQTLDNVLAVGQGRAFMEAMALISDGQHKDYGCW